MNACPAASACVSAVWVRLCWPVRRGGLYRRALPSAERQGGEEGVGAGAWRGVSGQCHGSTQGTTPSSQGPACPSPRSAVGRGGYRRPCLAPFAPAPGCRARDLPWPASRLLRSAADTPPCRQGVLHCTPVGCREAASRGARVEVRSDPTALLAGAVLWWRGSSPGVGTRTSSRRDTGIELVSNRSPQHCTRT
jgi:hypothetical protein